MRAIKCEYECAREIISFNRHNDRFLTINEWHEETLAQTKAKLKKIKPDKFIITSRWFGVNHSRICNNHNINHDTVCISVLSLSQWTESTACEWLLEAKQIGEINLCLLHTLQIYTVRKLFFLHSIKTKIFEIFGIINGWITRKTPLYHWQPTATNLLSFIFEHRPFRSFWIRLRVRVSRSLSLCVCVYISVSLWFDVVICNACATASGLRTTLCVVERCVRFNNMKFHSI